jgi:hypothetical protein
MTYRPMAKMPNWHFQMKKCQMRTGSPGALKKRDPMNGPLFHIRPEDLPWKTSLAYIENQKLYVNLIRLRIPGDLRSKN